MSAVLVLRQRATVIARCRYQKRKGNLVFFLFLGLIDDAEVDRVTEYSSRINATVVVARVRACVHVCVRVKPYVFSNDTRHHR